MGKKTHKIVNAINGKQIVSKTFTNFKSAAYYSYDFLSRSDYENSKVVKINSNKSKKVMQKRMKKVPKNSPHRLTFIKKNGKTFTKRFRSKASKGRAVVGWQMKGGRIKLSTY